MENVGLFYDHLVYFTMAIWYILWQFSIFFPRFGILAQEKSGNPGPQIDLQEMLFKFFLKGEC
jgi:hypothetical protein